MIRQANKFDLPEIIRMLKNYRDNSPIKILREANNEEHIINLMSQIFYGAGFIFIAEKNDVCIGMLIAAYIPNLWNPKAIQCSEIAYWVEPEYRGSSAAYRLIAAYIKECEKLKEESKIEFYTIAKMINSPDLKFNKFGFQKLEETWIK